MARGSQAPSLFGEDAVEVRTPRRAWGGGTWYAGQVWDAGGVWQLGLFPSRAAARAAAKRFAREVLPDAGGPDLGGRDPGAVGLLVLLAGLTGRTEVLVPWALGCDWWAVRRQRRRSDGHRPRWKWVRKVKGPNTWQARPWLGPGLGSLNLGLFSEAEHGASAEWAAAQVARAFVKLWVPGRTVAEAVELLKRSPRRAERCRPDLTAPPRLAGATPPAAGGPTETAAERRERERAAREARREARFGRLIGGE